MTGAVRDVRVSLPQTHGVTFTADAATLATLPERLAAMLREAGWEQSPCPLCDEPLSFKPPSRDDGGRACIPGDANVADGIGRVARAIGLSPVVLAHRLGLRAAPTEEQVLALSELGYAIAHIVNRALPRWRDADPATRITWPRKVRTWVVFGEVKTLLSQSDEAAYTAIMAAARAMGLVP